MNLMVIPGSKNEAAGLITWWRLAGEISCKELYFAWEDAGLDILDLPDPPSASSALKRTLVKTYTGPNTLVRVLPKAQGYAIVDEDFDEEEAEKIKSTPKYSTRFRVRIDEDILAFQPKRTMTSQSFKQIMETVDTGWRRAKTILTPYELSSWFVHQADKRRAVKLRDTGGIYFVPAQHLNEWEIFAATIKKCSASRIFSIPALKTEQAVEAVIEALTNEAEQALKKFEQLDEASGDKPLGKRALKSRVHECDEIRDKIKSYEQLLAVNMKTLRKKFVKMQAAASASILAMKEATDD